MVNVLEQVSINEVFSTAHGAVYQDDASRCWVVDFGGKQANFDYRCLLKLRDCLYRIDVEEKLLHHAAEPDVEIIFICACDHTYVLSLLQVINLREILQGTFVMLELNQIIYNALYRLPLN
jgi:hypothetical protein